MAIAGVVSVALLEVNEHERGSNRSLPEKIRHRLSALAHLVVGRERVEHMVS